jgi:hypothetical protein
MRTEEHVLHNLSVVDKMDDPNRWKVIAYKITTDNMEQHFLRLGYSKLVNPAEITLGELKQMGEHFVKVTQEVYEKYMKVLHNESRVPFRSLERLI